MSSPLNAFNQQTAQNAARRRQKAAKLRARGWTLKRIGDALGGISRQRVHSLLKDQP